MPMSVPVYDTLDDATRKVMDFHLRLQGEIEQLLKINSFLIKQYHEKKCVHKGGKYHPIDKECMYYHKYLYQGRKCVASMDVFPFALCYLEDLMYRQIRHVGRNVEIRFIDVGLSWCEKPEHMRFGSFDENKYRLSDDKDVTFDDVEIFIEYRDRLLAYMQQVVDLLTAGLKDMEQIEQELKRLTKIMVTPPGYVPRNRELFQRAMLELVHRPGVGVEFFRAMDAFDELKALE